ncbi:TetR/AcrR family transcriptional regulator [Rhodococcoides yunnanense]|uniref:TetR/AcrR family transcriptional regulator n=1 Tax=Rhodococcoides yunnanense TaxID=278209 RepID=UPI000B155584|nr:TetR/AcrR family transcriptional regulator [Rhodococcus yunnanensis]
MLTGHDAISDQFIDAGVRALLADPRAVLERGLRSEDIVNQAGASQATFFRKFATKADFVDAVVGALSGSQPSSEDEVRRTVGDQLQRNEDSLGPTVIALVTTAFPALVDGTSTATEFLAHVFGSPYAMKNQYAHRDRLVLTAYEALFIRSDAALRRPFTARSFATTVTALLDGFRTRARIDPSSVTATLVADALLALLGAVVDTSGLHQHLDDLVGPIESPVVDKPLPPDPRAAIIAAARTELGKRGYFMTRMDDIADNAGVSRTAVKKLFPTKPHVLVAALHSRVDALRESVADDLLIGLDEITIIDNFLLRCAQLAADESAFMDALLVAVAHDTYGEPEGLLSVKRTLNIPAIIGPVIQQGQDNGTLSLIGSPVDLAAGITNTLLMRCFTRRNVTPAENAEFIGNLLLRGLTKS